MTDNLTPFELGQKIRRRVVDLNDLLILAALAEVDVEFVVNRNWDAAEPTQLRVYVSQEC